MKTYLTFNQLHGDAAAAAKKAGVKEVSISISHSESQAIAIAVSTFKLT
jgi:fatty acid synthase subunit alpha